MSTVIPCHCGSREAYWHGPEEGARVYCCDPCWVNINNMTERERRETIGKALKGWGCAANRPSVSTEASPEPKFQPSTIDPHAWTVVDSYERADGSRTWRAMGPWRATREEAERDAEYGSMLGALPELSAPSREGDQR